MVSSLPSLITLESLLPRDTKIDMNLLATLEDDRIIVIREETTMKERR